MYTLRIREIVLNHHRHGNNWYYRVVIKYTVVVMKICIPLGNKLLGSYSQIYTSTECIRTQLHHICNCVHMYL